MSEPSYGKAARRFNAEQALGRKVVEILRDEAIPCLCDTTPRLDGTAAPLCLACRLDAAALSLELIEPKSPSVTDNHQTQ